ncbi:protein PAXX isoform X2 [Opisthocomus hoazin]|uniref:protein PAXX isoform X2 n=1 Tax=Opisthocomus hoazin TaxID=30419 RepID=UPI003F539407
MAEPPGSFRLLRAGPRRYLCCCGAGGSVRVTDGLRVWAGELRARPPVGCRCQPEEHGAKLREAVGRGAVALTLGEGKATLQLREQDPCSALDLCELPAAEARSQLQALVLDMAGHVESLERRLEAVETLVASCSPEKNAARSLQLFLPAPKGRGLGVEALGVSWMRCAQAGCRALPGGVLANLQGDASLRCSAAPGPWLPAPLGDEPRLGPSSPAVGAGPAWLGARGSWARRGSRGCQSGWLTCCRPRPGCP